MKVKQVRVSEAVWEGLRAYAEAHRLQLKAIQAQALEWFLKRRESYTGHTDTLYLASPDTAQYRALWIAPSLAEAIAEQANRDDVSENRVIYTALCRYWESECHRSAAAASAPLNANASFG